MDPALIEQLRDATLELDGSRARTMLETVLQTREVPATYDVLADAHMERAYVFLQLSGQAADVEREFDAAERLYRLSMRNPPRLATVPMAETKLGILLSSPINPKHNLQEALFHFENAHNQGCQHATYWYGRALLNGFGIKRDTSEGFQLIQQAACNNVQRALFETAALHEEGCEGESGLCIRKNHVLAIEYYKAITLKTKILRNADPRNYNAEWINQYATSHLASNKEWHETESNLGIYVGSLFSWEFAGQAFLFGGVATLAAASELNYYADLLILLPVIGIIVAILSIIMSLLTFWQNSRRRHILLNVYKAKMDACESLVGPKANPKGWEKLTWLARLASCGEIFAVILAFTFLSGWIVLLW